MNSEPHSSRPRPQRPASGERLDAVVVGAGPNGLAAAVTLARAGRSVLVIEGAGTVGGGTRTEELTLPGFRHDVCSALHPLGVGSRFFRELPLERHGLHWIQPEVAVAHPIDRDRAAILHRSIDATAVGLGGDGDAYRRLIEPLVADWDKLEPRILGPGPLTLPRHPFALARFGRVALRSAAGLLRSRFTSAEARALLAGCAAHAFLPLTRVTTGAFAVLYPVLAHRFGWPVAQGGSRAISAALAAYLVELGGRIETGRWVRSLDELPPARAVLLDVVPRGFERIAGDRLPARYRRRLLAYRHGPAAFKVDLALDGPIPWANPALSGVGTVHLGGTLEEVAAATSETFAGRAAARPFTLVAEPSLLDPTRAPAGKHTAWAYAQVPHGSTRDFGETVIERIESFAPGFRERILARHTFGPPEWSAYNPNYVGGDISGGALTPRQLLFRPFPQLDPYATPLEGVYLCSSATPPGAGVHGMCGYWAARSVLRHWPGSG